MFMSDYNELSEQERKKLYKDFSKAAKEIKVSRLPSGQPVERTKPKPESAPGASGAPGHEPRLFTGRQYKRPSWVTRIRIDSYAYSKGFDICGLKQFLATLFSFLKPNRDIVSKRFAKAVIQDHPYKSAPSGYSLSRTLLEMKQKAGILLKGGFYLKRASDKQWGIYGDLNRDLQTWEPFGYKILKNFQHYEKRIYEALEYIRFQYDSVKAIDVFELIEVVKAVYRLSLMTDAPYEVIKERITDIGGLITSQYRRSNSIEQKARKIEKKIDQSVDDFLVSYARLKWFAHQLYPALLKMLNRFKEESSANLLADEIFAFLEMDRKQILKAEIQSPYAEPVQSDEPALPAQAELNPKEEYKGILTILDFAFPGSRIGKIVEGDNYSLFWFNKKIFSPGEHRKPVISAGLNFNDLLLKISKDDPLSPVIPLHEMIRQMIESLEPDGLAGMVDPLKNKAASIKDQFLELRNQWSVIKEELVWRYLKEINYFEKESSLERMGHSSNRFIDTAAGRRAVETINQIRNHIIRGYGHIALGINRKEYFKCRPLYSVTQDLLNLLNLTAIDRSQIKKGNPILLKRLESNILLNSHGNPILQQINSYIDVVPKARRLIENDELEFKRQFIEILTGMVDLLSFLLNNPQSHLRNHGSEVLFAGEAEKEILKQVESDETPLRVELKKDFDDIDQLTGLVSKNQYLTMMPDIFRDAKKNQTNLTFLVMDIDHFKAVNDSKGHEFGDDVLRLTAETILFSMRDEDIAVRFGGEEILVVLKGNYRAGMIQGERIRKRQVEVLKNSYSEALEEIVTIMAGKELVEKKKKNPRSDATLEEYIEYWKQVKIGTLSVGVAQGLGRNLTSPCTDEKELFKRADTMMYLAKDSGRNRVVGMGDELGIPLNYSEFKEYQKHTGKEGMNFEKPLTFTGYPAEKYYSTED